MKAYRFGVICQNASIFLIQPTKYLKKKPKKKPSNIHKNICTTNYLIKLLLAQYLVKTLNIERGVGDELWLYESAG